jgi:hypothetical protein
MIISKRQRVIEIGVRSILGIANIGDDDFKIKKVDLSCSFKSEVEIFYAPMEYMREMKENTVIPYGENENVQIMSDVVLTEKLEPIKSFVYSGYETIISALDGLIVEPYYGIVIRVKTYKDNSIISTNIII